MRPFHLEPSMKTLRGVFYPTGWMVLMFPSEQEARDAAKTIEQAGVAESDVLLLTPEDFRREIIGATGDDDLLPSAGTEGDTVRKFSHFARQGHYGLMIHCPKHDDSERILQQLAGWKISYGQKYRTLVIEDVAG